LKGNNDLLILTQPDAVRDIHLAYFRAGRGHRRDQHLLGHLHRPGRLRHGGDRLRAEPWKGARLRPRGGLVAQAEDGRRRFVAGAVGPTNRTLSISPDVNNPGYRAVTFDGVRDAYAEQVRGLVDGGA
jgi:5-methyltetrahydrofolate--homocysteine methyltransferase